VGKGKSLKGIKELKELHGETCQCRRCRARVEALERRPLKIKRVDYANFVSRKTDDEN
jgi:hypothetical protein